MVLSIASRAVPVSGVASEPGDRHGFAAVTGVLFQGGKVADNRLPLLQEVILHLTQDSEAYDLSRVLPIAKEIVQAVNAAPAGAQAERIAAALSQAAA